MSTNKYNIVDIAADALPDSECPKEADFIDLLVMMWREKLVALIVTSVIILFSAIYITVRQPSFESVVYLLPPLDQNIKELNRAQAFGLLGYTIPQVYEEFIRNLNSRASRRKFFDSKGLYQHYFKAGQYATADHVFENSFNKQLRVGRLAVGDGIGSLTVSFEFYNAEKSALLLNDFVRFASERTIEKLVGNVHRDIASAIGQLNAQIASKRETIKQRVDDTVARLEEAVVVAEKLGVKKPEDFNRFSVSEKEAISIYAAGLPLYARGVEALNAELEVLKSRKTNEPFIEGLRDMEERLAILSAIEINSEAVRVMLLDEPAFTPYKSQKLSNAHILLSMVCVAVFAGFAAALLVGLYKQFRNEFVQRL